LNSQKLALTFILFCFLGVSNAWSQSPSKAIQETVFMPDGKVFYRDKNELRSNLDSQYSDKKFPSSEIRIIVPFSFGGIADVVSRAFALRMAKTINQSVVISNSPNTLLNLEELSKSSPNGYVLGIATSQVIQANLIGKSAVNLEKDFQAVIELIKLPYVLVTSSNSPYKTIAQLIKFAKDNPGKLRIGVLGTGSGSWFTSELFKKIISASANSIEVRPDAIKDALVSGTVDIMFVPVNSIAALNKSGQVNILAISSSKRLAAMPDTPTFNEAGYSKMESYYWIGLFAPKGTPLEIITKLNVSGNQALKLLAFDEKIISQEIEVAGGLPVDLESRIKQDLSNYQLLEAK